MGRHFNLQQAESLLPEVERSVREALALKASFQEAEGELQKTTQRLMMLGGAEINRQQLLALRGRRDATAARLKEILEEIQSHGCLVKDLDIGLLDFPTFYRGDEVYLCWKLGEDRIRFWHAVDEGFRGRKAIDEEFLENHRGDREN